MTLRLLWLHARARGVPGASAGLALVTLLTWWAGSWMMQRPYFSDDQARIPVAALAPLLAAGLATRTLAGADAWLERSTPAPWPRWRTLHVLIATLTTAAALSVTGLHSVEKFGAYAFARGCVGYLGLMALTATVVGVRAAWLPVLAWAGLVYLAAPRGPVGVAGLWAWPLQPWSTELWPAGSATLAAAGCWLLGSAAYSRFGARATTDRE